MQYKHPMIAFLGDYRQTSSIKRAQYKSLNVSRLVLNEDAVGTAPTGHAPTTSEWSTSLLPTKVRLILEAWRYGISFVRSESDVFTAIAVVVLCAMGCNVFPCYIGIGLHNIRIDEIGLNLPLL